MKNLIPHTPKNMRKMETLNEDIPAEANGLIRNTLIK